MRTKSEVQDAQTDLLDDVPAEVDFDALTDLFLEEPAPAARIDPPPAPSLAASESPTIEVLIMGHLPTIAGAWAAQYARRSFAADRRPVALIRDTSAGRTAEVFPASAQRTSIEAASAEQALARLPGGVARIILRADEIDEPDLVHSAGGAALTLLTGADDAAIVSAYRTIKRLLGPAADRERTIAIGMMGAKDTKAQEAFERLRRAAHAFLGIDLTLRAVCPAMTPEPATLIWRGERPDRSYGAFIERLRRIPIAAAPVASQRSTPKPGPTPTAPTQVEARPKPVSSPTLHDDWVTNEFFASPDAALSRPASLVPRRELLKGIHAVEIRCPVAPEVDLGVDGAGRLHLLVDDRSDAPMEGLLASADWAVENLETLALAVAAKGLPAPRGAQRPELHAMTRSPARARRMLRCGVRVHVIADVAIDGRTATACVDLN